eukprot:scaffold203036_cov63-Attheya_sp.AAC.1
MDPWKYLHENIRPEPAYLLVRNSGTCLRYVTPVRNDLFGGPQGPGPVAYVASLVPPGARTLE